MFSSKFQDTVLFLAGINLPFSILFGRYPAEIQEVLLAMVETGCLGNPARNADFLNQLPIIRKNSIKELQFSEIVNNWINHIRDGFFQQKELLDRYPSVASVQQVLPAAQRENGLGEKEVSAAVLPGLGKRCRVPEVEDKSAPQTKQSKTDVSNGGPRISLWMSPKPVEDPSTTDLFRDIWGKEPMDLSLSEAACSRSPI